MTINIYEEIRTRVSVPEVAQMVGLSMKHNFVRCPFHADNDASLRIYGDHWRCYGCGEHGDAVALVARYRGISQKQAAAEINERFSLGLDVGAKPQRVLRRKRPAGEAEQRRCYEMLDSVADFIRAALQHGCSVDRLEAVHDSMLEDAWLIKTAPGAFIRAYIKEVRNIDNIRHKQQQISDAIGRGGDYPAREILGILGRP